MIYLIDDNQGNRREMVGVDFVDDGRFKGILTIIDKLKVGQDIDFLKKADCILLHDSFEDTNVHDEFIPSSNTNKRLIIEEICDFGDTVSLVVFSNGMAEVAEYNEDSNPNCIYSLNKDIFYSRLKLFLLHFQEQKKINLSLLAFGETGENKLSRIVEELIMKLINCDQEKVFEVEDIKNIKLLKDFFTNVEFDDCDSFDLWIQSFKERNILVKQFIKILAGVLKNNNKYGKNIGSWKSIS